VPLTSLVLLLTTQAAAPRSVATSVEKLAAKAHRVGARVEAAALVVPATAIRTRLEGKARYFALAVAEDGPFVRAATQALEETRAAAPEAVKLLHAGLDDDLKHKVAREGVEKLFERLAKLQPSPAESVAVELASFDTAANTYEWETIVGSTPFGLESPWGTAKELPLSDVAKTREAVKLLAQEHPPDLSHALPKYAGSTLFVGSGDLLAYKRMVKAWNVELLRRRRYAAQRAEEDLTVAMARIERLLGFRGAKLRGVVIAPNELAGRAFANAQGGRPAAWLRETSSKGETVAERCFARASVLVASYPSGATVSLAGQAVGQTPHLARDASVGTELPVSLSLEGHAPKEGVAKVVASPHGVSRFEVALEPSRPPAPEKEDVWLVDAKAGKVVVTQEAPVEWTNAEGKKSRPELVLRCAGGEKEAYLFYALGYPSREGDIFAQFENEPKPKKYWGAPSQNGQSLFLTGFWGKGTDGFIKALLQHQTLTLTVKPKKKDALPPLIFELHGLAQALEPWLAACPLKK
jgi:hypothetical protein